MTFSLQTNQQLTVNPLYLRQLGLGSGDLERSASADPEVSDGKVKDVWPVVASSVGGGQWEDTVAFMQSVARHLPRYRLVMFDLSKSADTGKMVSVSVCV